MTTLLARQECSSELMAALGRIVVKWSFLEMMISDLFVHLSKGEAAAMIVVTSNVSTQSVASWIRTLLDLLEEQSALTLQTREVLSKIDDLRAERNALVHGQWTCIEGDSANVHTARLERREILRTELVTLADLDDTLERIREVTVDFVTTLQTWGVGGY